MDQQIRLLHLVKTQAAAVLFLDSHATLRPPQQEKKGNGLVAVLVAQDNCAAQTVLVLKMAQMAP